MRIPTPQLIKYNGKNVHVLTERKEAVETRERTNQNPNIEMFANFIEKAAKEATDPVFGYHEICFICCCFKSV